MFSKYMKNLSAVSLFLAAVSLGNISNAGVISIGGSGLVGTDRIENFDSGSPLGTNASNQFAGNGITINTISGFGVTLTSNSNCNNSGSGVTNQYLYAGLSGLCNDAPSTVDSFSILFDEIVSELSWSGFSRTSNSGFTIQALLNNSVVSSIVFDLNNRFENNFVNISGDNFNEIRVTENAANSLFFAMDDFAWNVAQVPEPTALALMGLGLAGLGFSRKSKRRKAA